MGTLKDSDVSLSDRQNWRKIFNAMVHMLQTQQTHIESFLKERKLLEERIKLQYDQISQMKRDSSLKEKTRVFEGTKSYLLMSMKQKESFLSKLQLENASTDLEDFKAWIGYLSDKSSVPNDILKPKDEGGCFKALENEVRRLKSENAKLVLNNNSEVSALLSEKNFVWNQYNKMESEKNNQLRIKCAEVEQANERIQNLLTAMEQLQSSMREKNNTIVTLKDNVAKLEADSVKRGKEIARLSRDLELLRKSSSDSITPALRGCTSERAFRLGAKVSGIAPALRSCTAERTSRLGGKNSVIVKKESCTSRVPDHVKDIEKGSKSSKRIATKADPVLETPKLFSSNFKVPKLKHPSPRVT